MNTPVVKTMLAALWLAGSAMLIAAAPIAAAETAAVEGELQTATFAAGCFWCVESDFDKVAGVVATVSGYTGGHTKSPTYEQVGDGGTGHTEAVRITFDPRKVTYRQLLDHFWRHVDFLDGEGQFCDRGDQYRPEIFAHGAAQEQEAQESKAALARMGGFDRPIAVKITPAAEFTPAEDYHQDYYTKNPIKYRYYRTGCGRDRRIAELWKSLAAGH